ncbi:MAG: hypothetical protein V9G11_04820 [Bifidobacterium adolescentis]
MVPNLPIDQSQFHRYFTAHWIEYATTGLFFIGIATVVAKGIAAARRARRAGGRPAGRDCLSNLMNRP